VVTKAAAIVEVPLSHPAMLVALLATAALVVVAVSFAIDDPDLGQHLTVGRAIWTLREIPRTHLWSWTTYGEPEVLPSWGFRALLWPVWALAGVTGLFVWRWVTTLAAFGLGFAAARRMGARGFAPLFVVALGVLVYRGRSMVRPETLVAPLFAATLALFEWRRRGGRIWFRSRRVDPAWLAPLIACAWSNIHISYWLLFLVLALYALSDLVGARGGRGAVARRWLILAFASALGALANPFGWRALAQPFEYFLFWRNEPIFKSVGELLPVDWSVNWRNGLPLLVAGWPILAAVRLTRKRFDVVELALCPLLVLLTLSSQRFMSFLALGSVPFLGRDLSEVLSSVAARPPWREPWVRAAALLSAAALLASPTLLNEPGALVHVAFDTRRYPVGACDFIAREGIHGRFFNTFYQGGYLLWRFWPERDRLPFMDIHQSGTRFDRDAAAYAPGNEPSWQALDRLRNFDLLLCPRDGAANLAFLDRRDRDSTWALVFLDDAAALYLRRMPAHAKLIDRFSYRWLGASEARLGELGQRVATDTLARRAVTAEVQRAIASSPACARAHYQLGLLAALAGRLDDAESEFRSALAIDPDLRRIHEGLGAIAAARGHYREALAEYHREVATGDWSPGIRLRIGSAHRALGDLRQARQWYERELKSDPGSEAACDSLAALDGTRQ